MGEKEQSVGNINHIAQDVVFNGDLEFQDHLTVSGFLLGNIKSENGKLDITKKGQVDGNITISDLNNKGKIAGKIHAKKVCLFEKSTSKADITTQEIMVEHRAKLSGQISMPDDKEA